MIWMAHASDVRVKGLKSFLHTTALSGHTYQRQTEISYLGVRRAHIHGLGYLLRIRADQG